MAENHQQGFRQPGTCGRCLASAGGHEIVKGCRSAERGQQVDRPTVHAVAAVAEAQLTGDDGAAEVALGEEDR